MTGERAVTDPISSLAPHTRRRLATVAWLATVGLTVALALLDVPLRTDSAKHGILSFELAGSREAVDAILRSWDPHARVCAGLGLGLDFLYPLAYSTALASVCAWAARRRAGLWHAVGVRLVWGQWLAAAFDAVENLALIGLLLGSSSTLLPPLAASFATLKFALLIAGVLYVAGVLFVPSAAPKQ